jgi:hypothetical protein
MKQVRHGIYKNHSRLCPAIRHIERRTIQSNFTRPNSTITASARKRPIFGLAHCIQTGCHAHRIAITASGREHRASGYRIPGRVSPLDRGFGHANRFPFYDDVNGT